MECMWFAFVSLSLIYLGVVANGFDHCNVHTTDTPVYPCRRDIVFVLDASTYMKTNENVERELDYVQQLISNWTFGADGVRVAFSGYGFDGDISFSLYYTSIAQCNKKIAAFRKKLHASGLSDYKLTDVLENIQQVYGGDGFDQRLFRHRAGVEPRFIVFSSTSDSEDIENSAPYFQTLYNNKYGTVLCVDLAATNLYSEIKTLRTVDMKGYAAGLKILGKEVVNAICLHDDRITPAPCTTTTSPSTTAAPTTPPPLSTTTSFYRNRQESQCSCTLSNLWLDIVIAIDTSESMSRADFAVFSRSSPLGFHKPQSTLLGISLSE